MSGSTSTFCVRVDTKNPGHFFACCGLLEIAHRIWPGVEGWFREDSGFLLRPTSPGPDANAGEILIECLRRLRLTALSDEEQEERRILEARKRDLEKKGSALPDDQEARRKQLGDLARAGPLHIKAPDGASYVFSLRLDWWQGEEEAVPKTWAGLQEVHKVARAAQDALSNVDVTASMLDHACVLRLPAEYRNAHTDGNKSVEPFYFDARRFAHALDAGFSLDAIGADTVAYPAVELLALIGLQRFRPTVALSDKPKIKASVEYCTWHRALGVTVAAAAACGAAHFPGCRRFRFKILARDDQKRYGAFGWATAIGGES
jgi:CRISPR-associated protein Csb3